MRGILGVFLVATALGFIPKYSNNLHKTRRAALVSATFKPSLLRSSSLYSSSLDIDGVQSDGPSLTPSGFGFTTSLRRIIELNAGKVKTPDKSYGFVKVLSTNSVDEVMGKVYSDCTGEVGGYVALVFDEQDNLAGIFTDRDYLEFTKMRDSEKMTLEQSSIFTTQPVSKYMTPAERLIIANSEVPAGEALKIMNANKFRHLIVGKDKRVPTFVLGDRGPLSSDGLCAVVSMADIMRQVQIDERLSLSKLQQKFPSYKYDPVRQLQEEQKSFANEMAKEPGVGKKDIIRAGTTAVILGVFATFLFSSPWLASHAELGLIGIFVLGYVGIIFEELFEFNKAGVALLMSTAMWITYADFFEQVNGQMAAKAGDTVLDQLKDQLAEVSDICFFLLAASTIVEVVDAHQGFKTITNRIPTENRVQLFWIIGILTFFLSSILNNLTVTIVMISLLRKIIPVEDERRLFGAMVVVAANAGGVWTPIGDVTTTMLWINGNLSTLPTITQLALPSIACLVTSLAFLVRKLDDAPRISAAMSDDSSPIPVANVPPPPSTVAPRGQLVFTFGILSLLSVPVFSELTGLPPYLAMLTGLGAMWTLTDAIHMDEDGREGLKVPAALSKLDTSGILFFLGILMSIGVLDKAGLLKELAVFLNNNLPGQEIIATVIGLASALIDNVPLVAATMGMYDLTEFGPDNQLWQLIALCAGTGGSILVIGSASGVALMGLEKVDFVWYAKNVSFGAAMGYFAGIGTYLAQSVLFGAGGAAATAPALADMAQSAAQNAIAFVDGIIPAGVEVANAASSIF